MEAKKTDSQTSNTQRNSSESQQTTNSEPIIVQGACSSVADIWRARVEDLGDEPSTR